MALLHQPFRLADEPGSCGLSCDESGLALAGVPLLRKTVIGFEPRPKSEIGALIKGAYGHEIDCASMEAGLGAVAEALNRGDLARATITALHLRLPEPTLDGAAGIAKANHSLAKYPGQPRDWHGRWTFGRETYSGNETGPSLPSLNPATATGPFNSDLIEPAAYNGYFHDVAVAEFAAYLRSKGETVQTEVRLMLADGSFGARIDILAFDPHTKMVYGVEVKTGDNPGFTPKQIMVYPHLMLGGSVVGLDSKIGALGLSPYTLLPPIRVLLLLRPNAATKPDIRPLDPTKMSRYYRGIEKWLMRKLLSDVASDSCLERAYS